MYSKKIENFLRKAINEALTSMARQGTIPAGSMSSVREGVVLEIPADVSHGDLATNIALRISGLIGKNPMDYAPELARRIGKHLEKTGGAVYVEEVEVKRPGFINFRFSEKCIFEILNRILEEGEHYGKTDIGVKGKVNIEFVSANPTGPLTIAHGRQAAFGDSLANILGFANVKTSREYFINDEGNQINLLGESIRCRYLELFKKRVAIPKNGYHGDYIKAIAAGMKDKYGSRYVRAEGLEPFAEYGLDYMLSEIKSDLKRFNVTFKVWFSQRSLTEKKRIDEALKRLKDRRLVYESGGAVWFKSTEFGDDKDRVIIKSTGEYTYLAPDIAYHEEKFRRGFVKAIDIWGPDHHGYIPRIKAAVKALGHGEDSLEVLIVQLCTLYKGGEAVQMSTRAGKFITLGNLMDEVGVDAARYFFLRRKRDSHLDFDLELAKNHSPDNPVYYIQYAHARICSIMKYYKESSDHRKGRVDFREDHLRGDDEKSMIKLLGRFTNVIETCAENLEVFPLVSYLEEVAAAFHSYYNKYRFVTDDRGLTESRLFLCRAIRTVIANGLKLLGVRSPENM